MSEMNDTHAPTPEFRSLLERDMVHAFRRESQFASSRSGSLKRARTVFVLTIGLVLGIGSGFASAQVQDARQRDLIQASAAAQRELLALRVELARTRYDRTKQLFETGVITRESMLAAEAELRAAEVAVQRLELELAESRETSKPARDELWAPKVGKRDFVKERLLLEASVVEQKLRAVEADAVEKEKKVRLGVITRSQQAEIEVEKLRAMKEMDLVAQKLKLREQYHSENLAADEITRRLQIAELGRELSVLQEQVKLAEQRLLVARRRQEIGAAGELEVKRAEVDLLERRLELTKLIDQLQRIERRRQEQ